MHPFLAALSHRLPALCTQASPPGLQCRHEAGVAHLPEPEGGLVPHSARCGGGGGGSCWVVLRGRSKQITTGSRCQGRGQAPGAIEPSGTPRAFWNTWAGVSGVLLLCSLAPDPPVFWSGVRSCSVCPTPALCPDSGFGCKAGLATTAFLSLLRGGPRQVCGSGYRPPEFGVGWGAKPGSPLSGLGCSSPAPCGQAWPAGRAGLRVWRGGAGSCRGSEQAPGTQCPGRGSLW